MKISCKETVFTYNMYHMAKAFFPDAKIEQCLDEGQEPLVKLELDGGSCFCIFPEEVRGEMELSEVEMARGTSGFREMVPAGGENFARAVKHEVTRRVYDYFSNLTGQTLSWGMLTGVRPTKLATQIMMREEGSIVGVPKRERDELVDVSSQGRVEIKTAGILEREYAVTPQKARLAVEIARREQRILAPLDVRHGFSLYVGIPFCPSICSYCSFSSSPVDLWRDRTDAYLDALCLELSAVAVQMEGQKLNTIYIGGGTPTSLEAGQLKRLLTWIDEKFERHMDGGNLLEYTVEAGRPDSITKEKLEVIRRHPVTRISINPQTMQQRTLDTIGRRHTVREVYDIFAMARELGFDNINMDLIAGLPGEDAKDMCDTLRQIEQLRPDSLTIHSLAIKRAARMGQERRNRQENVLGEMGRRLGEEKPNAKASEECEKATRTREGSEIEAMVEAGAMSAERMGLLPYYLYRQKNIAGNFENVGYAKSDKAGIYNILIMEEVQSIIACGAGSVSKRVYPDGRIERCENVKDVASFIERIDEMIERKRKLLTDF